MSDDVVVAELLGTINRLTGERDRARDIAVRLLWEADIAQSGQAMVYQMTALDAYRAGIHEAIETIHSIPIYRWPYEAASDQYQECITVDSALTALYAVVQGEK